MFHSASALFVIHCIGSVISQTCDIPYSCVNQSLSSSTDFFINAYKAAIGPTTSFSLTNGILGCVGAFSCQSMSSITVLDGIICQATRSCSNTSIETASERIKCYGFQSCASSILNVTTFTTDISIRCNGEQSCAYSRIYPLSKLAATGKHSLYSATIHSQTSNSSELRIWLLGELAGYSAKLICGASHVCHIYCYGMTSCFMFYIDCIGTCHVYANGTAAPTTNITHFSALNTSVISTEELCNTHPNARTYDEYGEQRSADILISDSSNSGPICCRGRSSCSKSNIRYNTPGQHVICSGSFGCNTATIDANNGSVSCEGADSCHSGNLHHISYLYCRGLISCQLSTIISARYITCSADDSCSDATVYSAGTDLDLDFRGFEAGQGATIYCNDTDWCNIRCTGYRSCFGTVLNCGGTCTVDCDVSSECPVGWTSSPTPSPTMAPSAITGNPTFAPSGNPSAYPSVNPSANPSPNPSAHPSSVTLHPSAASAPPSFVPSLPPSLPPSVYLDEREVPHASATSSASTESTINTKSDASLGEIIVDIATVAAVALGTLVFMACAACALYMFCRRKEQDIVQGNMAQTVEAAAVVASAPNTVVVAANKKAHIVTDIVGAEDREEPSLSEDFYDQSPQQQTKTTTSGENDDDVEKDDEELYQS